MAKKAFESEGRIPESLGHLFMRGVTDEYGQTVDITVPLFKTRAVSKYAYLAVFDNSKGKSSGSDPVRTGRFAELRSG